MDGDPESEFLFAETDWGMRSWISELDENRWIGKWHVVHFNLSTGTVQSC